MGTWPPQCRNRKHGGSCQVKGPVVDTPHQGLQPPPVAPRLPGRCKPLSGVSGCPVGWDPGPSGQGKCTNTSLLWGHPFWKVPAVPVPLSVQGTKQKGHLLQGQTGVPCRLCVKLKEGKAPKCPSVETGACQGHPSVDGQTRGRWGESRPTVFTICCK